MTVNDTFTDTAGVNLNAHTGETGATWTKHASYTGDELVTDANRIRCNTAATAVYYASGTPDQADYDVNADVVVKTVINSGRGIAGRINTGANTMYYANYSGTLAQWQLFKVVAGTSTSLGTANQTLTNGQSYALKLRMTGTTISLSVDGTTKISVTDNAISAAGKAGTRSGAAATNTTGMHLDNFQCIVPPHGLTYSSNPAVYTQNQAITANNPTLAGGDAVDSYTVDTLPTGLAINAGSGSITGTPTGTQAAANSTVTATNTAGSATCAISIEVDAAPVVAATGGGRKRRRELFTKILALRSRLGR